jgi:hypothetical protein
VPPAWTTPDPWNVCSINSQCWAEDGLILSILHVSMVSNDWAPTLTSWRIDYWEKLGFNDVRGQLILLHDLEVNPYQRVAVETNHTWHFLFQNHKGIIVNDGTAGQGPGIYSYSASHSLCVNKIIMFNCEGSNTNFSSMMTDSTFHHWFNATLRGIKFCAWWSRQKIETFLAVGIV